MNHLKLEPVYLNTDLSDKTFDYLKAQKYLKYKNIDKFIKNIFLNDYPFGFIILDKNLNIFGFLGTMFSSRFKGDNDYIFCNLHTWIIDEEKRLTFFSQGKNILNPIFDYKCSFFAKPVNALVRLFLRYYKMEVIEMKYRVSFLLKPSNLFAEQKFKIIDDIIPEPYGGAHRHPVKQAEILKNILVKYMHELNQISIKELVETRKEKYLNITSDI